MNSIDRGWRAESARNSRELGRGPTEQTERAPTARRVRKAPRLAFALAAIAALMAPARAQSNANVVAVMEIGAPASPSFVLHGTIPVPPGVYPRSDGAVPFALVDSDGSIVDTQMEVVTRYPAAQDGADVVEILGRVKTPPGAAVGSRLLYKVVEQVHPRSARQVTPAVENLLLTQASVLLVAKDCFGHSYMADLSLSDNSASPHRTLTTLKSGKAAMQVVAYDTMSPTTSNIGAPNGALEHLFGVHAYYTAWQGEDAISLDLRINNGASGLDKTNPIDNPLGKVYFASIELWVRNGWSVQQQGPDPLFGGSRSQGQWTAFEIVEPNADGTMHFMPSQGQIVRRLALAKAGQQVKAKALLDGEGIAFCKRGFSPTSGQELYSWWNPQTARYFPQRHRLPELDHIGLSNIRTKLKSQLGILETAITNGTKATGYGMVSTPNIGWAHPWGVKYGGMTGGTEVYLFDGITTADAASNEGYRIAQLTHRAYADRQPDVLFNKDGQPTKLTDWIVQGANGPHVNMFFYGKLLAGSDPFGFNFASPHQVNWVTANNKKPSYEALLASYMPVDLQHYIRTTRSIKVLTWLGNDSMAKDDLVMRAEIGRLSWHHLPNNAQNKAQGGGLLDNLRTVTAAPGTGFKVGRGEGWILDTVNAAYSIGDDAYRASILPWYAKVATTFSLGQMACNGFVQSQISAKQLNGLYYQRQQYEMSIVENGLRGAIESALRGVDIASASALEDVLSTQINAMISPEAWDPVQKGPWKNLAMAPKTSPNTPYCHFVPPGGTSPGVEKFQNWSSFAYGYEINGNASLLAFAKIAMGGDLKSVMYAQKYKDLETRAALLALVQRP